MAGRARFVAVFYHDSTHLPDGTQKLGYLLYDAISNRTVAKGSVSCISSAGSLAWAGFDNKGSLLAMDSSGMLSMWDNGVNAWLPVLDLVGLRKSNEDSHWPITANDGKLECVPLKEGAKYPDATRRLVTTAIGFRM
jgi:hypothetical protein